MSATDSDDEALALRVLRTEPGIEIRAESEGHSFELTNSGVPVDRLTPMNTPTPSLTIVRPARREGGWRSLGIERTTARDSLVEILDDLREDRA